MCLNAANSLLTTPSIFCSCRGYWFQDYDRPPAGPPRSSKARKEPNEGLRHQKHAPGPSASGPSDWEGTECAGSYNPVSEWKCLVLKFSCLILFIYGTELESSASQVLGKCSTSKLHPESRKSVSCIERRKKKKWNKTKRLSLDREYLPTPEIRTRHEVANDFSISLLEKDQERVLEHLQTQMSSWLQTKIFITSEEGLDGPVSKCVRDNWLAIWENQTSSFSQAMHRDGFQMAQRISMLKAKL